MSKYIIVGGVAGGATAAARLRRLDEHAEIVLFERGEDISFANCGLPYYVGDVIAERGDLLLQTPAKFRGMYNVDVRVCSEVVRVDTAQHTVEVRSADSVYTEHYDALLLSPGAKPLRPSIPGIEHPRIATLRSVQDADRFRAMMETGRSVVVVGGGFIGVELAENFCERGLSVTLVEAMPHILPVFDADMISLLEDELRRHGVELVLGDGVAGFEEQSDGGICVRLGSGREVHGDFVALAIGVRPDTFFLEGSGIALGARGHILVDEYMRTNVPDVYAVGDAVLTRSAQTGKAAALPLAGPANRQARLAADSMAGVGRAYRGVIGTAALKVFGRTAAATGQNERALQAAGLKYGEDYRFTVIFPRHHVTYYPGAQEIALKLMFRTSDGVILGAQAIGSEGVDKRIDVIAAAIGQSLTVADLQEFELSYAPPYSAAKDPVNMAGYAAENILQGRSVPLLPRELAAEVAAGAMLIDVRPPQEYHTGEIAGAQRIPLPQLRERLHEFDPKTPIIVCCKMGLRGYLAEQILRAYGFTAKNMVGGYYYLRMQHEEEI
ncbi:FAD-dependent oxidoreductase [uncultured Selenomonas sp.]|uniref:FAD-dependent oxidoreductase n=1 Tax=uncultured Selenomonas sp. TaxID=159275 RepID=UPI0028ED9F5E|nr:FAD-dependent oxidoreductase [uncultured Selenomonas sp.]